MKQSKIKEYDYKSISGILSLRNKFDNNIIDKVCERANACNVYSYKENKNLIYMGKFKPGVIKYAYSIFEVPKNYKINNLVLTDTSKGFKVKFKINLYLNRFVLLFSDSDTTISSRILGPKFGDTEETPVYLFKSPIFR